MFFSKNNQFITHSIPFLPSDPIHEKNKSRGLNKTERQGAHNYQVLDDVIIKAVLTQLQLHIRFLIFCVLIGLSQSLNFQTSVLVHHFLRLAFIAVVLNMLGKVSGTAQFVVDCFFAFVANSRMISLY